MLHRDVHPLSYDAIIPEETSSLLLVYNGVLLRVTHHNNSQVNGTKDEGLPVMRTAVTFKTTH